MFARACGQINPHTHLPVRLQALRALFSCLVHLHPCQVPLLAGFILFFVRRMHQHTGVSGGLVNYFYVSKRCFPVDSGHIERRERLLALQLHFPSIVYSIRDNQHSTNSGCKVRTVFVFDFVSKCLVKAYFMLSQISSYTD